MVKAKSKIISARVHIIIMATMISFIVFMSGIPSGNATVFQDDFNDEIIGNKWVVSGIGNTIELGGKLQQSITAGTSQYSHLKSAFKLSGNFDIQLDFDLITFPSTHQANCGLLVKGENKGFVITRRSRPAWPGSHVYVTNIMPWTGDLAVTGTSDFAGKFRITRQDSVMTSYVWDGSSWIQHGQDANSFTDDVTVTIWTWNSDNYPAVEVHWDNFQVNSGTIIGTHPEAVAGTSLDGSNILQLDGTLSTDPEGDQLTFSWQIEGEETPRTGQIKSISDLPVGNYQVTLTVSDGTGTDTDTMLFGVPAEAGVTPPPPDGLQEQVQNTKDKISNSSTSSFDAPNDKAAENRRKALLNMLDKVSEHIDAEDFQAAIDQLEDILAKSDALSPPDSAPDWIIDDPSTTIIEQQEVAQLVSDLIGDLEALL